MTSKTQEVENRPLHYIVYVDGGARPNPGFAGYGIHGYAHDQTIAKQGQGAKVTPSIEGYLRKKDGSQEINVIHYIDGWGTLGDNTTNNVAELVALRRILQYLDDHQGEQTISSVRILADSEYAIQGVNERIEQWANNNWQREDQSAPANVELWQEIHRLWQKLQASMTLTINWVKGHDGDLGNHIADMYATRGVVASQKGYNENILDVTPAKGYWHQKFEFHRLLCKTQWYFLTNQDDIISRDGRMIYHIGHHGNDDNMVGKKISDSSYAVVFCRQPQQPMEAIRQEQHYIDDAQEERFIIARLSTLRQPKYALELMEHGGKYLQYAPRSCNLFHPDGTQFTKEMQPARLAFRAVETLSTIESLLEHYLDSDNAPMKMITTDITELVYQQQLGKKDKVTTKLHPDIQPTDKSIDAEIRYQTTTQEDSMTVSLCFDMDLPSRNALSALAPQQPTIHAVTWRESNQSFRFATVVAVGEDIGLYTSFYSNLILLNR